jgi:hypothetical protein
LYAQVHFKAIKQNVAATEEDIATKEADAVATTEVAVATTAASLPCRHFVLHYWQQA